MNNELIVTVFCLDKLHYNFPLCMNMNVLMCNAGIKINISGHNSMFVFCTHIVTTLQIPIKVVVVGGGTDIWAWADYKMWTNVQLFAVLNGDLAKCNALVLGQCPLHQIPKGPFKSLLL